MNKNNVSQRLKNIFISMIQRCYNANVKSYERYGGRGIIICDEWLNDRNKFYEWALNNGYQDNLTIDRINNDGIYEPNNCKWSTYLEQGSNKRNNILIESGGVIKNITQWSKELGVCIQALKTRLEKNNDILVPYIQNENLIINGKTLKEIESETELSYDLLRQRIDRGWISYDKICDPFIQKQTKYIEINGKIHTAKEWAEISGLTSNIILSRMRNGWKNEDLLKPRKYKGSGEWRIKLITIDGVSHTSEEWAKIANLKVNTFYYRVRKGIVGKDLLLPVKK